MGSDTVKRRRSRVRYTLRRKGVGRARLSVFISHRWFYAQVIDDVKGQTLVSASSCEKDVRGQLKGGANKEAAAVVGRLIGERASAKGVTSVVFDRGHRQYGGRLSVLADSARKAGLSF